MKLRNCCLFRRLDSNALVCDCDMMWLADMLKEKHGYTQAAATCEYPHSLQGRSLMSINKDDFHCGMHAFFCCCCYIVIICVICLQKLTVFLAHMKSLVNVWPLGLSVVCDSKTLPSAFSRRLEGQDPLKLAMIITSIELYTERPP